MNIDFSNIWCWLIPLLTGLICAIIGYYWGRGSHEETTVIDNSADLKLLTDKNSRLQADLDACKGKLTAASAIAATTATAAAATFVPKETLLPFDAAAAKAAMGKVIKQDDLKVVEGIGPKISGMFVDGGIKTWKALSEASVADCQKILDTGGDRYKIHDPASWPLQAKMCYEGQWAKLSKWQDEHKHGKL